MSTNGDKPKVDIICPACKQHFSTPMPRLEISNSFSTSCITAAHPNPVRCINAKCRTPGILMLGLNPQSQLGWGWQPVKEEFIAEQTGSSIIKPDLHIVN